MLALKRLAGVEPEVDLGGMHITFACVKAK